MAGFLAAAGGAVSLLGGIASLIGALQGPEEQLPQNMNKAQTAELLRQVTDAMARAQAGQQGALQELDALSGQLNQFKVQMDQINQRTEQLAVPDSNQAYERFLQKVPQIQQIAQDVAAEATSPYADQREIAQRRATEAARMAQATSAGRGALYSGDAIRGAAQAAGGELANYEAQLARDYGTAYANQFGSTAGAEQQLTRQDIQQEYANEIQKATALLQNITGQAGITGTQGQFALGKGQLFQDSLNNLQGIQAQLMGPQFASPTFVENQFSGIGQSLVGLGAGLGALGNINQANAGDNFQAKAAAAKANNVNQPSGSDYDLEVDQAGGFFNWLKQALGGR